MCDAHSYNGSPQPKGAGFQGRLSDSFEGSALECGAVQHVLQVCGAMSGEENEKAKALLDRIVAMLTKLGRRESAVGEELGE